MMIVNKIDLAPYVDFDASRATAHARAVNPTIGALHVSARTGEGVEAWCGWGRVRAAVTI